MSLPPSRFCLLILTFSLRAPRAPTIILSQIGIPDKAATNGVEAEMAGVFVRILGPRKKRMGQS
jgi:hypothetical protein